MNPGAKCVNWCAVPPATGCSQDYPALARAPIAGTLTVFIEVVGIEQIIAAGDSAGARVTLPLKTPFNSMQEFALEDRDGWVLTMAEKVR